MSETSKLLTMQRRIEELEQDRANAWKWFEQKCLDVASGVKRIEELERILEQEVCLTCARIPWEEIEAIVAGGWLHRETKAAIDLLEKILALREQEEGDE